MTMGDVNGIIENQKAIAPSGFLITLCATIIAKISGTVMGSINCCVSVSLSTAEPMQQIRTNKANNHP